MKKAIKIFAVIAVICAFCLTAVACAHKDASDHTATGDWLSDATHHWHACENEKCEDAGDKAEHVFANACDADCDICGATRTPSAHVYDNACDATCNVCSATRTPDAHVYDNACDATCNVCGATRTPDAHVYDNACDADCNICGATRTPDAHVYDNACDETCNVCSTTRTPADHIYDNACDTTCNVCGAVREVDPHAYNDDCDTTCNACGAVREVEPHVYDNDCDTYCNVCGAERAVSPHVFDNNCDNECNNCGGTNPNFASHVYDDDCDATCNVCGATRTTSAHIYDNACDTTCNVCGAVRNVEPHNYSDTYSFDENGHWHECACGAKTGEEEHEPATEFITDETHHWKECACGQVLPKVAHHYNQEVQNPDFFVEETDTAHVYHMSCICGAEGTETFEVAKIVAVLENVQMPAFITYGDNYEVNYATNSDGEVAIIWYKGNKQLLEKPIDVGFNYYVQVIIAGTTEYAPVESELIPFEINPRVISGFSTNLNYNGSDVRRIDISHIYQGVELEVTFDGAGVGASVAGVKVFENGDESSNYIVDLSTLNIDINPVTVRVLWTAPESLYFDGTEKVPTATLEGVLDGDECYVEIMLNEGDNVWYGSSFKYVTNGLAGTDADNYALPFNGSTCTSPEYTITTHQTVGVGDVAAVGSVSWFVDEAPYVMYYDIELHEGFYYFDYTSSEQGVSFVFEIYEKGELYSPIATYEVDEYSTISTAFEITAEGSYYVKAVTSDETQYEELTIVKDEHTEINTYGFCTSGCGTYLGTTLTTNTWETVTIQSGDKVFYRFADAGDVGYNLKYSAADAGNGLNIKCYRLDNEGNFIEVPLSEDRTEFVGSFDGYYYVSFGFVKLGGGEKSFTFQIEQTDF